MSTPNKEMPHDDCSDDLDSLLLRLESLKFDEPDKKDKSDKRIKVNLSFFFFFRKIIANFVILFF